MKTHPLPMLRRLAGYRWEQLTDRPGQLPINLTLSVTYRCPSRCATCNVWQRESSDLSVDEYARLLPSLRKVPVWVTLSGGDQFVRSDFDAIVALVQAHIDPAVINIPMSGVISARVHDMLPRIAAATRGSSLVLNLSVDEIGPRHDELRGAPRSWDKVVELASLIRDLQKTYDHLVMGVHTVISRMNVQRIPEIEREVRAVFQPDSYITEVAERRVELKTLEHDITPDPDDYRRAVTHLQNSIRAGRSAHPVARLVQALRLEYYDLAARTLASGQQAIDCYAGRASAHVAPDGDVWGCCVRAEPLGNVRDHGYDFAAVWRGAAADAFRDSVKRRACACPLANASYTNMLLDAGSLARVAAGMTGLR